MLQRHLATALAVGALALTAACSDSTTGTDTSVSASATLDAATVAGDAMASDVEAMLSGSGQAGILAADNEDDPSSGCLFSQGLFRCPIRLRGGLGWQSTLTFYDAASAQQDGYDPMTTASIHIDSDISGSVDRGPWSADIIRHRHFIVSGLEGDETTRIWDGEGSDTLHRQRVNAPGTTREYEVTSHVTVTSVVVPVGGSNPWPTSGTMSMEMTFTAIQGPDAGTTFTRSASVTFDGTPQPGFLCGGRHFRLHLETHAVEETDG
jgi:hypothetical protein